MQAMPEIWSQLQAAAALGGDLQTHTTPCVSQFLCPVTWIGFVQADCHIGAMPWPSLLMGKLRILQRG